MWGEEDYKGWMVTGSLKGRAEETVELEAALAEAGASRDATAELKAAMAEFKAAKLRGAGAVGPAAPKVAQKEIEDLTPTKYANPISDMSDG